MGSTKRVVTWNAKVGRPHDQVMNGLGKIIHTLRPQVICLQEFGGYLNDARSKFGKDWYCYGHYDWPESADNPVLVRREGYERLHRGIKAGWGTIRTMTRWVGPEGGEHQGRTWTWVNADGLWVMSLHRATDGDGQNKEAFKAEHDKLVKWIGYHTPCVIIGDHNCWPTADWPNTSLHVAQHAEGRLDPTDGIDYAIRKGTDGKCTPRAKYGSDHPSVLWVRK